MGIKEWLVEVAVKKALGKAITSGVLALGAVIPLLKSYGVDIQLDQALLASSIGGLVYGGYEFGRNWLKQKFGIKLP